MPLVKIEIRKGRSKEHKSRLLNIVHQTLVDIVKIPENDRIQRLYELDIDNFEISSAKTDNFTIIEVTMFKGRTIDTKKKFLIELASRLNHELSISANDLIIVLHELPLENWGIRGVNLENDYDLGFKIDV